MRLPALLVLSTALAIAGVPRSAYCQQTTPLAQAPVPELEIDSDPAQPVFLSVRPEFYSIREDVEQRALILRYDARLFSGVRIGRGAPGVVLRFEVPFASAEVNDVRTSGLGDSYAQFFIMPYARNAGAFLFAVGSGFLLPTASDERLGAGKWIVAPVAAPIWRFPGGLFLIKLQNLTSVAGDSSKPDVNYFLFTPIYAHVIGTRWWIQADTETKTKWTDEGRTGVKSGVQFGRRFGRGLGVWLKPEVWWGPNRDGRWNLKFGFVWYERRK
jgi:hypothetical protein